jgi:hypothetical protein
MAGVSPTAWMYFALSGDPLLPHVPFTDDPIVPTVTPVSAAHVLELRARIDGLRSRFGLPAFEWATAIQPGTTVSAQQVDELRSALAGARAAAGHVPPLAAWTDPTLVAGQTLVKAAHIGEIRAAVRAIE